MTRIRNVALIGHSGAGKSTLAEAMLMAMGSIARADPTQGPLTSDYDGEEARRHQSLQTTLLTGHWQDVKINLVDTPGLADFAYDTRCALRAVDAAILVLDGVKGLEAHSARLWDEARQLGLPVFVAVTKLDADKANFAQAVASTEPLQTPIWPLTVPTDRGEGVARLLEGTIQQGDRPASHWSVAQGTSYETDRTRALEAATEDDDALLERYLNGETVSQADSERAWRQGVVAGRLIPAFATSARTGGGIPALLDALVALGPNPDERPADTCLDPTTGERWTLRLADETLHCAWVFKTLHDPYAGKISLLRVYAGTLHPDETAYNATRGQSERFGRLSTMLGKQPLPMPLIGPGDIGAVAKLKETQTGDTIIAAALSTRPFVLAPATPPPALYAVALLPHGKGDESKLATVLSRLKEADPSLSVSVETGTRRTVLGGQGPTHVEIALARLAAAGVQVGTTPPQIPYRETITTTAQAQGKHKKQTGGHGQYGDVWLRLEPLGEGEGYQFASEVVGGVVPKPFIPAVDKGVQEALAHGGLIGAPVVDLRAVVYDGSHHSVDSSEMSFKMAAQLAFKKAFGQARPILLEPMLRLAVTVPEASTGDVISDLTTRRARVQGIETLGAWQVVRAIAPMSEVVEYSAVLTSVTRGAGSYSAEFAGYEPVPQAVSDRLIAAHRELAAKA